MTRKEAVRKFLDQVRLAYIEDQKQKNIRASGRSAEAFRVEPDFDSGKLYGASYLHFQAVGRKPGRFPPIEAIIKWIKEKFKIDDERSAGLKGLAFIIARKIANKGTDISEGKRPGLNIEDKILEYRKELVSNLLKGSRDEIISKLRIRI